MKDAKDKVLAMVQEKKISSAEGDALIAAMARKPRFSAGLLVNPFARLAEPMGLGIAIVTGAAAAGLSVVLGIRFDGFLDIHAPLTDVTFTRALIDQAVAWPLAAIVIWGISLPFARQGRIIDLVIGVGVARVVQTLGAVGIAVLAPPAQVAQQMAVRAMEDPAAATGDLVSVIPMILVAILFITWFIAAIVFAIKHATGLRGGKLAAACVLGILVAEIISKLALAVIPC